VGAVPEGETADSCRGQVGCPVAPRGDRPTSWPAQGGCELSRHATCPSAHLFSQVLLRGHSDGSILKRRKIRHATSKDGSAEGAEEEVVVAKEELPSSARSEVATGGDDAQRVQTEIMIRNMQNQMVRLRNTSNALQLELQVCTRAVYAVVFVCLASQLLGL